MADALFPIPNPDFLFVHSLVVWSRQGASVTPDADGRWQPGFTSAASAVVTGYLAGAPDVAETSAGQTRGESVGAVALVPIGTAVSHADEVEAVGISPALDGRYTVTGVRPNPSHLRVLLTRSSDPVWPPP